MSAFIVSKETIDAICYAAIHYPHNGLHWKGEHGTLKALEHGQRPDAIGEILWHENVVSVRTRYPDDAEDSLPGPNELTMVDVLTYRFTRPPLPSVVEALKLIDCLEYQSCEHDEWDTSEACHFLGSLRRALIRCLPGYEKAPWGR